MTAPGKRRAEGGPEVLDVEILVRVNRDRREAYKAACKARGTTMADVARRALEDLAEGTPASDRGQVILGGGCGHVYPDGSICADRFPCPRHWTP